MALEKCQAEWEELEKEFQQLQETHKIYKQKLDELTNLQTICSSSISKQKKSFSDLKYSFHLCKRTKNADELEIIRNIECQIKERKNVFFDMEAYLPKKNGPDGLMYQMFRNQFLAFSIYQSFVQFLQYYYQSGCLYRLRALGERNHLDLTVEGFQSWMWRGLTFLLPFLFFGHVFMLALTFLLLFLGNFLTTLKVVHQKFHKNKDKARKKE
ncbi:T120B protein, partial [Polypterus senegalus]